MPQQRDARGRFLPGPSKRPRSRFVVNQSDINHAVGVITDRVERNLKLALIYATSEITRKLQRGQKTRSVQPRNGGPPYRVGMNPSKPGEPPKKVTGRLVDSIAWRIERQGFRMAGYIGANTPYARALEFGYAGTDAAGRTRVLAPRPYLRSTVMEHRYQILYILRNGRL